MSKGQLPSSTVVKGMILARSPSSALLPFLRVVGSPTKNRLQRKVGTLILTSLLEDLVGYTHQIIILTC